MEAAKEADGSKHNPGHGFLHRKLDSLSNVANGGQTDTGGVGGPSLEAGYEQVKGQLIQKDGEEKEKGEKGKNKDNKQEENNNDSGDGDDDDDDDGDDDDDDDVDDGDDENLAAVAELTASIAAPQASKIMLPLAMKFIDAEFLGLSRIPIVKKKMQEFIKLAVDGVVIGLVIGSLGTVRKTMAKAAKRLRDWMAVRKRKGYEEDGADDEVDDTDDKRRSRPGSVGGVLIQLHGATKAVGSGARRLSKAVVNGVKDGVTVDDVRRTSRRMSHAVAGGVKEGVRRISRRPKPIVPVDPRERRRARTRAAVKKYFSGGWQTALAGGKGADAAKSASRARQNPTHAASWQLAAISEEPEQQKTAVRPESAVISEEPEQQKTAVRPDLVTTGIEPANADQEVTFWSGVDEALGRIGLRSQRFIENQGGILVHIR
jgi:hypothetical protein